MNIKIILLAVSAAALTSCSSLHNPFYTTPEVNKITEAYNFNYEIQQENPIKLSQAFNDKNDTFITFSEAPASTPEITLIPENIIIPISRSGNYWKVDGVYPSLQIAVNGKSTSIKNNSYVSQLADIGSLKK